MKKITFIIAAVLALSYSQQSNSQGVSFSQTVSNPTGTISNAGIDTMTYHLSKGYDRILFSMTYTRSANTAAGTVILEYKLGTSDNYVADAGDTLTVTNAASKTYYWNKANTARYWRMRIGGATTVTATVVGHLETN